MSVGLPSDEVAEDYKNSLEDLAINSRYEISNLTVIAKENTEHAAAISRVLEKHIKTTVPDSKLPALYVLDSIVKNVGTPYTLFLGHSLYNTFMDAYASVAHPVRRKLDEMLRTWKEPVPFSNDPRPVFPSEITRPIENALIRWRTISVNQQQQIEFKNQQEMINRRHMPTPISAWQTTPPVPQMNGIFRAPQMQGYPQTVSPVPQMPPLNYLLPNPPQPQYPQQLPQQPTSSIIHPLPYHAPPAHQQYQMTPSHYNPLHRDVEDLIQSARTELTASPWDIAIQGRLKALLDLQNVLNQGQLQPHEVQAVRDQISRISPASAISGSVPLPGPILAQPNHQSVQHQQVQRPSPQAAPPPGVDLQALLSSNNLADIIAKASRGPPVPASHISAQPSTLPMGKAPGIAGHDQTFLASLRASGLLSPSNGSSSPFAVPPTHLGNVQLGPVNDVVLNSSSIKGLRPHLISTLYEARPNQCMTCGRRFLTTDEGREKKARHLDWHFRTNQRLVESIKRGQSRSWYVGELDWIKSRDDPEGIISDTTSTSTSTIAANKDTTATSAAVAIKNQYLPVPVDKDLAKLPCPICQEKFDTVWNDEAQDFVWMDAIKIGSRIYHGTCHGEIKREGGSTPGRTGTPDSVLGKRKAMVDVHPASPKLVKAS